MKFIVRQKIAKLKRQIEMIEQKRYRSQAALIEAILEDRVPTEDDSDFFNKYTKEIEALREQIRVLMSTIESYVLTAFYHSA